MYVCYEEGLRFLAAFIRIAGIFSICGKGRVMVGCWVLEFRCRAFGCAGGMKGGGANAPWDRGRPARLARYCTNSTSVQQITCLKDKAFAG